MEIYDNLFKEFVKIMPTAFLAGSSVLHAYMSLTKKPNWTPNDIDVWVPVAGLSCDMIEQKYTNDFLIKKFNKCIKYFSDNGFKEELFESSIHRQKMYKGHNQTYSHIYKILYFNKDNIKIQVIFLSDITCKDYIKLFDISICCIGWDLKTRKFILDESIANGIANKKMWSTIYPISKRSNKNWSRIWKYKNRGFDEIRRYELYQINYEKIKNKMNIFKKELIETLFNPIRFDFFKE